VENVDEEGLEVLMTNQKLNAKTFAPEVFDKMKIRFAAGHGGFPVIGSPDDVADGIERVHKAGFHGLTLGFVNALRDLPYVQQEVMPRLVKRGVRNPAGPC